jgi:hypothetical protein
MKKAEKDFPNKQQVQMNTDEIEMKPEIQTEEGIEFEPMKPSELNVSQSLLTLFCSIFCLSFSCEIVARRNSHFDRVKNQFQEESPFRLID